jgi:hypothetical protein
MIHFVQVGADYVETIVGDENYMLLVFIMG